MNYEFSDKMSGLAPSAIREILKYVSMPGVISLAGGNPSPLSFPKEEVLAITTDILTNQPDVALQYSMSEGYPALIKNIEDKLLTPDGLTKDGDSILVTAGAQQAIELFTKCICNPGDTVIAENPSFIGALNAFRSYNCNLAGVDLDDEGIIIEELEKAIAENDNVKVIYLIPNFQNPSGKTMSLARRKAVYEIAKKNGILILEDNPYGKLRFEGEDIPAIKTFDEDGIVAYCGSFSKILAPGLRVGYIAAPAPIVTKMVVAKQCTDVHTTLLSQMICGEFLNGDYEGHIQKIIELYRGKRNAMITAIKKYFPDTVSYTQPEGGLFIWCTLPAGMDSAPFCKTAVENKVATVPGATFNVDETATSNCFRLNFSMPSDEQIDKGIKTLGELLSK